MDKKKRLVKVGRDYAVLRSEEEEEAIAEAFSTLMQDVGTEKAETEKEEEHPEVEEVGEEPEDKEKLSFEEARKCYTDYREAEVEEKQKEEGEEEES